MLPGSESELEPWKSTRRRWTESTWAIHLDIQDVEKQFKYARNNSYKWAAKMMVCVGAMAKKEQQLMRMEDVRKPGVATASEAEPAQSSSSGSLQPCELSSDDVLV